MIFIALRRLLQAIPILFAVSIFTFLILEWIPGDPALALLGPMANAENLAEIREELNLDASLPERYSTWVVRFLQGDWGESISLNRPVRSEVLERFQATAILASSAFVLALGLGLGMGVLLAIQLRSRMERFLSLWVMCGVSTPSFGLGLLFVLLFSIVVPIFPSSGMAPVYDEITWASMLPYLVLPALTLAIVAASLIARVLRARLIEILDEDFIRTFRSAGLSESRILWRHAIPNALVPMIPLLGLQAGYVLGGAVYVETIFAWPGLGRSIVEAIQMRDVQLVQAGVLVIAATYILINLAADLLQNLLDHRTR